MKYKSIFKKIVTAVCVGVFLFASSAEALSIIPQTRQFNRGLALGARGMDVRELQMFLNLCPETEVAPQGRMGSKGMESTVFGPSTRTALIKYQLKVGVIASATAPGAGRLGPVTRDAAASRGNNCFIDHPVGWPPSPNDLPVGCTSTVGFSPRTGQKCDGGQKVVMNDVCTPNSAPWIKIISPNGGEMLRVGQTYPLNYSTCNLPQDAWIAASYSVPEGVGTSGNEPVKYAFRSCNVYGDRWPSISSPLSLLGGGESWKVSDTFAPCGLDYGMGMTPRAQFQSKLKMEVYTGGRPCSSGMVPADAPCLTAQPVLRAQDESDAYFTITNN